MQFEARTVKEQVYFDPTAKVKKFVNFEELIDDDDEFEDERFKLAFVPGELNNILESAGYIKEVEDAMIDFKIIILMVLLFMVCSSQEVLLAWISSSHL